MTRHITHILAWLPRSLEKQCSIRKILHAMTVFLLGLLVFQLSSYKSPIVLKFGSKSASAPTTNANGTFSHNNTSSTSNELSPIEDVLQEKLLRHSSRKVINPHRYNYIHNSPYACSGQKVDLFIGVLTRTNSFALRSAVRDTWGDYGKNITKLRKVVLFFLGATLNQGVQEMIDKESLKYGDIVQEDYIDSYRNLSLKSVSLFRWVSWHCSHSDYVLKADDDMYINTYFLVEKLQEKSRFSHLFIMGELRHDNGPIRRNSSKYYVSVGEFPFKAFPSFVSGTAYAMTTTAAMKLYIESSYYLPLHLEDVYLTGIVADRASIPKFNHKGFTAEKVKPEGFRFKNRISGHRNTPADLRKIHKELWG